MNRRAFVKSTSAGLAGFGILSGLPRTYAPRAAKTGGLPRSTPEAQGLAAHRILAFVEAADAQKLGLHSLMIVRHGHVIAEGWWDPYRPDLRHTMYSLSKSFTATAVGFAAAEGRLNVEDKVLSFFPEDRPATVSAHLAAMRIKDLLTMSTGHEKDTLGPLLEEKECCWAKKFLSLPVPREPGTHFLYNTGATYMLSAVLRKVTGKSLLEYLTPRLFNPLGIEGADWETDPDGIATGGFGLRIRTEDIARFGQLYLQKGVWNGKQLLPAGWVAEATAAQVSNVPATGRNPDSDWQQGYGYQFWRCRHNAYRGDGAMGQYCIVMPERDAVVAITAETHDMQAVMNRVWDLLLPHMQPAPLAPDPKANQALRQKLATLTALPARAAAASPWAAAVSGKAFAIGENDLGIRSVSFAFAQNTCTFTLRDDAGAHTLVCGLDGWAKGETIMPGDPPKLVQLKNGADGRKTKVAGFATWTDPDTLLMTWDFYETPHSDAVTCHFTADTVRLEFKNSIEEKLQHRKEARLVLEGRLVNKG